jgi:hypothetical protein
MKFGIFNFKLQTPNSFPASPGAPQRTRNSPKIP